MHSSHEGAWYMFIAKTQLQERNTFPVDGENTMQLRHFGKLMRYQDV